MHIIIYYSAFFCGRLSLPVAFVRSTHHPLVLQLLRERFFRQIGATHCIDEIWHGARHFNKLRNMSLDSVTLMGRILGTLGDIDESGKQVCVYDLSSALTEKQHRSRPTPKRFRVATVDVLQYKKYVPN